MLVRHSMILLCSLLLALKLTAHTAFAGGYTLPITPVNQFLTTLDRNGDTGATDCMAAAFATALQTLRITNPQLLQSGDISYQRVRTTLRMVEPNITKGITPGALMAATPVLTDHAYRLIRIQTDASSWENIVTAELKRGYPVIVHVSDRNALFNPQSTSEFSHVIVVYAIDDKTVSFADSWGGKTYVISKQGFQAAWGKGYYNFLAFTFLPEPPVTSFKDIVARFKRAS